VDLLARSHSLIDASCVLQVNDRRVLNGRGLNHGLAGDLNRLCLRAFRSRYARNGTSYPHFECVATDPKRSLAA